MTQKGPIVAEEQVTSPDQRKPTNIKGWRIAGVVSILVLLTMLRPFGQNHQSLAEDAALLIFAGLIAALLIGDAVMRRNGLIR